MLAFDRLRHIDPDLEALTEAEGIAHRAGPRPVIPHASFDALRTALNHASWLHSDTFLARMDCPQNARLPRLVSLTGVDIISSPTNWG